MTERVKLLVKPAKEDPPTPDLTSYASDLLYPYENYSKKELKALKVPARKNGWLMVCVACPAGVADLKSIGKHLSGKNHKLRVKEYHLDQTLSRLPTLMPSQLTTLTSFVESTYHSQSAEARGQLPIREGVAEELGRLMIKKFPEVKVQLHGSVVSKFAVLNSNININLDIPGGETAKEIPCVMNGACEILSSNDDVYVKVKKDFYAFNKIPRILFTHKKTGLKCEIRAMAGNPMALAPLLKCYGSMDQRVGKLGVAFLYWAKICKLDVQENGYYPAHMFIVMAIHFLQQTTPPVLPVLHELAPSASKTPEGEEEGGMLLTEEELDKFTSIAKEWHSQNTQSVGELWLQLLRYYISGYEVSKLAVSIRKSSLVVREERQWGSVRLAVEDPMIPKNNLARCGYSDLVYDYYLTCLKQTVVYFFTQLANRALSSPSKSPPPTTPTGIIDEDSSVVFATFAEAPPTNPELSFLGESTITPTSEENADSAEISIPHVSDKQTAPNKIADTTPTIKEGIPQEVSTEQVDLTTTESEMKPEDSTVVLKRAGIMDKVDNLAGAVEELDVSFREFPKESTSHTSQSGAMSMLPQGQRSRNQSTSPNKSGRSGLTLCLANCVLKPYPIVCSLCKNSAKHTYKNCPIEKLPNPSSFPIHAPSQKSLDLLWNAFKEYMKNVAPDQRDKKERKDVCNQIIKHVRNVYPDAHLKLFGSSANGFGLYTSDLDICLILPGTKPTEFQMEKTQHKEIVEKIAKELSNHKDYEQVVPITTARVPIVKFYLPRWNLDCDISMENRLAMRNTEMLKAYSIIDERVRILGYAVKKFAKVCDMGDASAGSLSSYAYILLMLHYLQQTTPPVIPVLQQVYSKVATEGPIINNWNCYYYQFDNHSQLREVWSGYKKNTQSVGELWLGFLKYVLMFNWGEYVVTIRQLEPLLKFDKWWITKPLCIEDPFNLDHNLGSSVSAKMRTYILDRFLTGLWHHSENIRWQNMDQLMDNVHLVGDCKAPKFMTCHHCGVRGHLIAHCPVKAEEQRKYRHKKASHHHKSIDPPLSRGHTHPQQVIPQRARPVGPRSLLPHPRPHIPHRAATHSMRMQPPMGIQPTLNQPVRLQQPPSPMHSPPNGPIQSPNPPMGMQSTPYQQLPYQPHYQHMFSYPPTAGYPMGLLPSASSVPHSAIPTSSIYPTPGHTPPTPTYRQVMRGTPPAN